MKDKKNPRLTVRDFGTERLNTRGRGTSTDDVPVREEARRTVAAVLAAALRQQGKL
jgi:hypothetical protein